MVVASSSSSVRLVVREPNAARRDFGDGVEHCVRVAGVPEILQAAVRGVREIERKVGVAEEVGHVVGGILKQVLAYRFEHRFCDQRWIDSFEIERSRRRRKMCGREIQ